MYIGSLTLAQFKNTLLLTILYRYVDFTHICSKINNFRCPFISLLFVTRNKMLVFMSTQ